MEKSKLRRCHSGMTSTSCPERTSSGFTIGGSSPIPTTRPQCRRQPCEVVHREIGSKCHGLLVLSIDMFESPRRLGQ